MTRPVRSITSAMTVYREGNNPVYGESAVTIRVQDDGVGWYFEIKGHDGQKINIELDELRKLLDCAESMAVQEPKK